jgi:DNA-binding GntR family transcriptional regulator
MEIIGVTKNVFNFLRDKIISEELKPGQKLNELNISKEINVSRPPIREAFRLLENERLVINIPRKGTYVIETSKEDLEYVYQVREMIECYAIDLLEIKNIRDLPAVESSNKDIPLENPINKLHSFKKLIEFHTKLVEASGNHLLIHFYQSLHSSMARYQFKFAQLPSLRHGSEEDHLKIIEYIKEEKYSGAKDLLRTHIRRFKSIFDEK